MTKYRPYSRDKLRRLRWAWVKRNLKRFVLVTAAYLGLLAAASVVLLMLGTRTAITWYFLGAIHAGMVVAYLHLFDAAFIAHDREAIFQVRGAWGEENTSSELTRAKRRRVIWDWVDSISLEVGDIDHLVITRRGGLVAIDSKWRNQLDPSDTFDMARAGKKVRQRAEGLAQTLLRNEAGARHRSRTNPLPVTPVVVVWGALQHEIPDGATVDGIDFVPGRSLLRWLRQLDGQTVDRGAGREILERLDAFRAGAWDKTRMHAH